MGKKLKRSHFSPLNNWLLIESGGLGSLCSYSCSPTGESTSLCCIIPNPWSHRWLWLNSVVHGTKQTDMNIRRGLVRRRRNWWGKGRERLLCCEGNQDALYTSMKLLKNIIIILLTIKDLSVCTTQNLCDLLEGWSRKIRKISLSESRSRQEITRA